MKYKELKYMNPRFRKMSLNELGMTEFVQISYDAEWFDDEGHNWRVSFSHIPKDMYNWPLEKVFMELLPSSRYQFPWVEPFRLQGCSGQKSWQLNLLTGDFFDGWDDESQESWISNFLE